MREFQLPEDLRAWVRGERAEGRRIGFVPTMGALHEGHLRLIDAARANAQAVILSIFVNPLQFGPKEDLSRYPRDLESDRARAASRGASAIFVPAVDTMYPMGAATRVIPGEPGAEWEGAVRPGHFAGVLTVVAKLFHLVQPDVVVFGQKDIQQAVLIRRMIADLNFDLQMIVVPTVRESDGLALSSRNVYLGESERVQARTLSQALRRAHELWQSGERRASALREAMEGLFRMQPNISVDYIAIADPDRMRSVEEVDASTIVALAARVGATRLIDNITLGQGPG
jgi:pantoate--beta-alanine ligase